MWQKTLSFNLDKPLVKSFPLESRSLLQRTCWVHYATIAHLLLIPGPWGYLPPIFSFRNLVGFLEVKPIKWGIPLRLQNSRFSHFHSCPHSTFSDWTKLLFDLDISSMLYDFLFLCNVSISLSLCLQQLLLQVSRSQLRLSEFTYLASCQYSVFPWKLSFLIWFDKSHYYLVCSSFSYSNGSFFQGLYMLLLKWKCLSSFKSVAFVLLSSFLNSIVVVLFPLFIVLFDVYLRFLFWHFNYIC